VLGLGKEDEGKIGCQCLSNTSKEFACTRFDMCHSAFDDSEITEMHVHDLFSSIFRFYLI